MQPPPIISMCCPPSSKAMRSIDKAFAMAQKKNRRFPTEFLVGRYLLILYLIYFIYIYNHIILFTCFQSPVHSVQTEFFTWNNETVWNWFSSSGRVNPTKNSANEFCNWLSIPRRSFASQNAKPNWWGVGYKEIMQAKRCETPSLVDGHLLCVKEDGSRVCPTIIWWWDTHMRT